MLVLQLAGLDVLLGVVPGATAVVEDVAIRMPPIVPTISRPATPASRRVLRLRRRTSTRRRDEAEDQADHDRHADGQHAGRDHLAQGGAWP